MSFLRRQRVHRRVADTIEALHTGHLDGTWMIPWADNLLASAIMARHPVETSEATLRAAAAWWTALWVPHCCCQAAQTQSFQNARAGCRSLLRMGKHAHFGLPRNVD